MTCHIIILENQFFLWDIPFYLQCISSSIWISILIYSLITKILNGTIFSKFHYRKTFYQIFYLSFSHQIINSVINSAWSYNNQWNDWRIFQYYSIFICTLSSWNSLKASFFFVLWALPERNQSWKMDGSVRQVMRKGVITAT